MGKNPTIQLETITPDMASAWLGKNKNFRALNEARTANLARAIATGRFEVTNDAITFDSEGNLTNGQHRLKACCIAQKSIQCFVARNVASDTFIDVGQKRTQGQLFTSHSYKHANTCAAVARLVYFSEGPGLSRAFSGKITPDNGELLRTMERHPRIEDAVGICRSTSKVGPASIITFVYYFAAKRDREMADLFVYALSTGDGIGRTDSVYWLRERLLSMRGRWGGTSERLELLKLIVKAWNLWANRTPCRSLRIADGEEIQPIQGPQVQQSKT